jgi:hypothetical protein
MSKVAKLVFVSMMTRIVVEENATDAQMLEAAKPAFLEKVSTELGEHLEQIVDDTECPFGTFDEDK